jgi:3-isopropylmalate/(R)-2-methylmalate dehydratase small subunit
MDKIIESKAVLLGNNIDTDQIYPGRFLALVEPEEIGRHCLAGIDEETQKLVPGSIVVAGTNFGCGSSREHAVITLLNAPVKAVVAESFSRIFFRNAINLGLPLITCKGINQKVKTGQQLRINVETGLVTIVDTGETIPSEKLGEHVLQIINAGGIKPLFRAKYANTNF